MTTAKIQLDMVKEPDLWRELSERLGLDDEVFDQAFEYGDYANIEIEVDEELNIVGGRFIRNDAF